MAQRVTGINNNFKVYVRLRPAELQKKMIECISESQISILDPASKTSEKQIFSFNRVFDQMTSQETLWANTCEPVLQKVIEGHNAIFLSYGQTGAGKTYTIFGEDDRFSIAQNIQYLDGRKDRRGLICQSVDYFFRKAKEQEELREYVLTVSCAEIYQDFIRDLGRSYAGTSDNSKLSGQPKLNINNVNVNTNFQNENLQILENSNNQIIIKDLTLVQIKSLNELYDFIHSAFQLRERFETKDAQLWARSHTIFTVNIVQKDKENENTPFMNSSIQFVDLAGSERIAKIVTEGNNKVEQAIIINQTLNTLSKCLQMIAKSSKIVPYKDSRLTKVLQNCMTYSSHTILVANLNPSESNYEECLATLQYADRCRNAQQSKVEQQIRSSIQGPSSDEYNMGMAANFPGSDKLIKKLQEENQDLKSKIEFTQREAREKIQKIQQLLGPDVDLDKILNKSSQKELQEFKQLKEAKVKFENTQKLNEQYEHKIESLHKFIEDLKKDESQKQESYSCQVIQLKEQNKALKEKIQQIKMQADTDMMKLNKERDNQIKYLNDENKKKLEDKLFTIMNLPTFIDNKTNENQKINDAKKIQKLELEKDNKVLIDNLKQEYQKYLDTARQQYEFYLNKKNEEMDAYVQQLKKYRQHKKQQTDELKLEISELYDIVQKQALIISKIETGQYSGGIRSFNIPQRDKPNLPTRFKFKHLFNLLDQKHIQSTLTDSKMRFTQKSIKSNPQEKQFEQSLGTQSKVADQMLERSNKERLFVNSEDLVDLQVNLTKFTQDKDFQSLIIYAQRIKDSLQTSLAREKEMKDKIYQFEQINNNIDINKVVKERDYYEKKYLDEVKKNNQTKIIVESQKRLLSAKMNSPTNRTQTQLIALIRPQTVADKRFRSTIQQNQ